MPVQTTEVPCDFVGDFKVGDNLVYNTGVLHDLVDENKDGIFNKMIVIQVGSILEAALAQLIYRAQNYNREGVPNIKEADRREIEGKKVDKFAVVIDVLRKYKVLDELDAGVYDDLHKLRKYRNKIHIQEKINILGVSADEYVAFSDDLCEWALNLNLRLIQFLSDNFSRPPHIRGHVQPLRIPHI